MSDEVNGFGRDDGDVAPGVMDTAVHSIRQRVHGYLLGLGLATLLTVGSFCVAGTQFIWVPAIPIALVVLAIAQIGVHLVFFLHITRSQRPKTRDQYCRSRERLALRATRRPGKA